MFKLINGTIRCRLRAFSIQSSFSNKKVEAYDHAQRLLKRNNVCVILVNPWVDENVGSVSRAMLNYGFTELRIVAPQCDILSEKAMQLAVGSHKILENATIFPTLESAISDLHKVYASTSVVRSMAQSVITPEQAAKAHYENYYEQSPSKSKIITGLVFGRERNGLNNEELALTDAIITIPSNPDFPSLNLAQAVHIICYEMFKERQQKETNMHNCVNKVAVPDSDAAVAEDKDILATAPATRNEVDIFLNKLFSDLKHKGYQKEGDGRRELYFRGIRHIFQKAQLKRHEISLLHGVISSLTKKVTGSSSVKASSNVKVIPVNRGINTSSASVIKKKLHTGVEAQINAHEKQAKHDYMRAAVDIRKDEILDDSTRIAYKSDPRGSMGQILMSLFMHR